MVPFSTQKGPGRSFRIETAFIAAFCSSPLFAPSNVVIARSLDRASLQAFDAASSFVVPFSLSAMTVALMLLFARLIRTSLPPIGEKAAFAAALCYCAGFAGVACVVAGVFGAAVCAVSSVVLGASSTVLAAMLVERLSCSSLAASLKTVWLGAACMVAFALAAKFVPPFVLAHILAALAVAAAVCAVRTCAVSSLPADSAMEGPNWWDVFGYFDVSAVKGADDFQAPGARGLFFVGVPLAMMLLFAACDAVSDATSSFVSPFVAGCAAALVFAALLLRFKDDQPLLNASYRFLLPAIAFVTFACGALVQNDVQKAVLAAGGFAFLGVYTLVMAAILIAMAGRMASLAVPVSGIMVVSSCLACLIAAMPAAQSVFSAGAFYLFVAAFVAAVGLLVATPGARLWRVVLEGVDAASNPFDDCAVYVERCGEIAREFSLTPREQEVLVLLGRGHTSAFVAQQLVIAESTARSHRKNIYRKLEVKSREELFSLIDDATEEHTDEQA